jgi:hypothetical protein
MSFTPSLSGHLEDWTGQEETLRPLDYRLLKEPSTENGLIDHFSQEQPWESVLLEGE